MIAALIVISVVWVAAAIGLRQTVHGLSYFRLERPSGRALVHAATFFCAPFHAIVVMYKSIRGIYREAKRPFINYP